MDTGFATAPTAAQASIAEDTSMEYMAKDGQLQVEVSSHVFLKRAPGLTRDQPNECNEEGVKVGVNEGRCLKRMRKKNANEEERRGRPGQKGRRDRSSWVYHLERRMNE